MFESSPIGHPSLDCNGHLGLFGGMGISNSRAGHDHTQWSSVGKDWKQGERYGESASLTLFYPIRSNLNPTLSMHLFVEFSAIDLYM